MKQLLTLLLILSFVSCSKDSDPAPGPPSYPHIFWNPNVTFRDYGVGIQNGVFYVDANLIHLSGLTKYELIRVDNPSTPTHTATPLNGQNKMFDGSRSTFTPKRFYIIRFTRTDNSTFVTPEFEA